ncbi:MAG TPA: enoyl-CoA hydratase-related protein [Candidatus Kapabacteria bacterium]|nr:enoyl-CoA hydratase-related protein [Candidatus Kapabacteria bacterium]HPO62282.1 enoyl-CoA hydratase-related protein [Candidatus Kapabacteria bacterium]
MNYQTLLFEKKNNIAKITLNRADKLNALNTLMMSELEDCIKLIEMDTGIRALSITGSGEKAFVAGADIKELNENNRASGRQFAEFGSSVFSRIEQMRIPVVAAINGYALGGGCELALACHIRFASENAKLGQTELNLGLIPGYGGSQRLPRIVGKAKAMEMILSAKVVTAFEAESIGLVNAVFKQEELMKKTEEFIANIISKGALAVASAIECINASDELSLCSGLAFETKKFGEICGTADFKEGTAAFLEKRTANFKGE